MPELPSPPLFPPFVPFLMKLFSKELFVLDGLTGVITVVLVSVLGVGFFGSAFTTGSPFSNVSTLFSDVGVGVLTDSAVTTLVASPIPSFSTSFPFPLSPLNQKGDYV